MAPEVIMTEEKECYYSTKADIWSIGITAIEIAEKNPPLSDIHPMKALRMIPTSDMGLAKPKSFSKPFVDFVNVCLTRDPLKRPSATELLKHPFMVKAAGMARQLILKDLVEEVAIAKAKKKAGVDVDDDEEEDKKQEPQKNVAETVKYATKSRQNQTPQHRPELEPMPSFSSAFGLFVYPTNIRDQAHCRSSLRQ
jgi:serine/threonine protein kinase